MIFIIVYSHLDLYSQMTLLIFVEDTGFEIYKRLACNFFFFLFKAGSSQARQQIRALAASLRHSHSNWDLSHICHLCHSLQQRPILNP